jgi:hypothetical protein
MIDPIHKSYGGPRPHDSHANQTLLEPWQAWSEGPGRSGRAHRVSRDTRPMTPNPHAKTTTKPSDDMIQYS